MSIEANRCVDELDGDICNQRHPGIKKAALCWFPSGHSVPHSWETLRPGETHESRKALAFPRTPRGLSGNIAVDAPASAESDEAAP